MPKPSTHLPAGTVIADKYELEGLLGEGGMGAVYQATNLAIGRRVAIKILNAAVADREDVRRRFELEARAAAVISHPGIVDVLDMGHSEEGEPFIVMEHLEGATLRSLVKETKGLTPGQSIGVMLQVLDALSAAHKAGVVHRDVKPANIFVCIRPQTVKLLDFGVSRFGGSSGLTHTGTAVGTPRYMAPEQVLGESDLGPEADLYSVGSCLYSLLSGKPPHGTGADMAVLARILHDTPAPLESVTKNLPPELCALVDSLLLKDRKLRPRDALKVRDELKRIMPDTDITPLFELAGRSARAAALSPTPSSSAANLPGVASSAPAKKATPSRSRVPVPQQSATSLEPTRESRPASVPAPATSRAGLIAAVVVAAIVLGGGTAYFVTRPAAEAPKPELPRPTPVVVVPVKVEQTMVFLTLAADPATARIAVNGVDLSCNPCELTGAYGSRQTARISAPDMKDAALELVFDKDRTEHVVLVAAPVAVVEAPSVVPDAGHVSKKKGKAKGGLSVDEKNPYE